MTTFASSAGGSYSYKDLRGLYPSVSDNHLRYLEKWGLLSQSSVARDSREYPFADLLTVKHVSAELERGTPLRVLLRTLVAERQGQLALDFNAMHAGPDTPRAKVIALEARKIVRDTAGPPMAGPLGPGALQQPPYSDPQSALAAKYFLEGSRLDDGDERTLDGATAAYRKALVIDPDLVPALVNLANIHYSQDLLIEAQALYERAVMLEPDVFEGYFNLGNIHHDLGRYDEAEGYYLQALTINPGYPEAHLYLAVALEKAGRTEDARPHWRAYHSLAPDGEWADLAREFSE